MSKDIQLGDQDLPVRRLALAYGFRVSLMAWLAVTGVAPVYAASDLLAKAQPSERAIKSLLLLNSEELIADDKNDRVVAKDVMVYYKDYALIADELIYYRKTKTLEAIGKVRIKEPDGGLINAERLTLSDDFREGFERTCVAATTFFRSRSPKNPDALARICGASSTAPQ